jgi:hypothetical protein
MVLNASYMFLHAFLILILEDGPLISEVVLSHLVSDLDWG